jgi:5-methylcytosine-specific restriction enzyme A
LFSVALNEASARYFINDYRHMLHGEVFKRAMSAPAMNLFLTRILEDQGADVLSRAVGALREHIDYYEGLRRTRLNKLRAVLKSFESRLSGDQTSSIAEMEEAFTMRVIASLKDIPSSRKQRLQNAAKIPAKTPVTTYVFNRNPDVVAEVLLRANGICELCKCPAPFRRARDGTPYLEVHHRRPLVMGGEDTVENAIAVCPNCHRCAHYGRDANPFTKRTS